MIYRKEAGRGRTAPLVPKCPVPPARSGDASQGPRPDGQMEKCVFLYVECERGLCISFSDKPDPEWYFTSFYVVE